MNTGAKFWVFPAALMVAGISIWQLSASGPAPAPTAPSTPLPASAEATAPPFEYGRMPLAFETNQGQTDPRVKFLSRGPGYTFFLTATETVIRLNAAAEGSRPQTVSSVIRMSLQNSNPTPSADALDPLPGRSSYYIGNQSTRWLCDVVHHARVRFNQVYPGIDLEYYGNPMQLEYDFIVSPEADPDQIVMRIDAPGKLHLDGEGNLIINTNHGPLKHRKPLVYQMIGNSRRIVESAYSLLPGNQVRFLIGTYDRSLPLMIDPVIEYSTYLGGTGRDFVSNGAIAVDLAGNVYIAGATTSPDFPEAVGYPGTPPPDLDAAPSQGFLAVISATGDTLRNVIYLGGSEGAQIDGIDVDAAGNIYASGLTTSADFPLVDPIQAALAGESDAFAMKFNPGADAIIYSTFLGGSGHDAGWRVRVDSSGAAYVSGTTTSADFPVTSSAFQRVIGGAADRYIAKINPAGTGFVYSTYFGGSGTDFGGALALDEAGNAYIAGMTTSVDLPLQRAYQSELRGSADAFVAVLNSAGNALGFASYLGGTTSAFGTEDSRGIAVDGSGHIYVTGITTSPDFPMVNAIQPAYLGDSQTYLSKINPASGLLVYSTFLGGTGSDWPSGVAVDAQGQIHVAGGTTSSDFPTTPDAMLGSRAGNRDGFVLRLSADGQMLQYGSYVGGTATDEIHGFALDRRGNLIALGSSQSEDFPTVAALQNQIADTDYGDAFLIKMAYKAPEAVLDFNGDGQSDILWRNDTTLANTIWRSANADNVQPVTTVTNAAWTIAGIGDFDGDGRSDVLWHNTATLANVIWRSGSHSTQQRVTTVTSAAWSIAGVGDFDNDGKSDILWHNTTSLAKVIWRSADYHTQQPVTTVSNAAWNIAGIGDFDGDGKSDILWRNTSSLANVIWRSADYRTQQRVTTVTNAAWGIAGIGDFDGDGRSDILWHNTSTLANAIWKSANYATQQAVTTVRNPEWAVAGVADFDGDGQSDIFWRRSTAGTNAIWLSGNYSTQQAVSAMSTEWNVHF